MLQCIKMTNSRKREFNQYSSELVLHPGFLLALFTMLVNDFVLQPAFHNGLTGKLSDVAGLYAFPILLTAIIPAYRKQFYVFTALLFIFWKSELSGSFIHFLNTNHIPFCRVADYSDLWALCVLPFSFAYSGPTVCPPKSRKFIGIAVAVMSIIVFCSDSLPRHLMIKYPPAQHQMRHRNSVATKYKREQVRAKLDSMGKSVAVDSTYELIPYFYDKERCSDTLKRSIAYWRVGYVVFGTDTISNINCEYRSYSLHGGITVWGYDVDSVRGDEDHHAYNKQHRKYDRIIRRHFLRQFE